MSRLYAEIISDTNSKPKTLTGTRNIDITLFINQNDHRERLKLQLKADPMRDDAILFLNGVEIARGSCPRKKVK